MKINRMINRTIFTFNPLSQDFHNSMQMKTVCNQTYPLTNKSLRKPLTYTNQSVKIYPIIGITTKLLNCVKYHTFSQEIFIGKIIFSYKLHIPLCIKEAFKQTPKTEFKMFLTRVEMSTLCV